MGSLTAPDYERMFAVLEDCDEAATVPDFAQRLLSALRAHFGMRHTTFFTGDSFDAAFDDPRPLLFGHIPGMFPEYRDRWSRRDAFASPAPRQVLQTARVASLREARRLDEPVRAYLDDFLLKYGLRSASGMWLRLAGGRHALVGMFDPDPDAVGERELAALRRLARQLDVISRRLPGSDLAGLTDRQRQVAELVAEGLTNAVIGRRLALSEDTVKKYVSRLLTATGCRSRTELALLVRT